MRRFLLTLCLAILFTGTSLAQTITKLEFEMDGSYDPPGDVIDVTGDFGPEAGQILLLVQPVLITGDKNDVVTAVKSKDPNLAYGQDNRYLIQKLLRRQPNQRTATDKIVIPYAGLDIPKGKHNLAYEVSLAIAGKIVDAKPTPISILTVSDQDRTIGTITRVTSRTVPETRQVTKSGYEVVNGQVQEYQRVETVVVQRGVHQTSQVAVNKTIPGEFKREAPRKVMMRELPSDTPPDPKQQQANQLKSEDWIPAKKRLIYFATNRNAINQVGNVDRFGLNVSGTVSYGSVFVNIPSAHHHERGQLEVPKWWQSKDPEKHFYLETVSLLPREQFLTNVMNKGDILLYIHGFNNSFADAMQRAAQLTHDIQFRGQTMAFSWPSQGSSRPDKYGVDETNAASSSRPLADVMQSLIERLEPNQKIHVVVHSMGNRVFLRAIDRLRNFLDQRAVNGQNTGFGHVVFAAPDIARSDFPALYSAIQHRTWSTTLYFNPNDWALKASEVMHQNTRLGQSSLHFGPLVNIDASNADTSLLGHNAYAGSNPVLNDLKLLINEAQQPWQRTTIRQGGQAPSRILYSFR